MNTRGTSEHSVTVGLPRYELTDKHGFCVGTYGTAEDAGKMAGLFFPGEQQDPDRTGAGWDVQVVGAE